MPANERRIIHITLRNDPEVMHEQTRRAFELFLRGQRCRYCKGEHG